MDPLSVTASIIAVLQLSAKVLGYLNDVKDAPKDRAQCAIETSNLYNLLFNLRVRVEEGDPEKPWYTAVRALAVENGPLDQFKQALETLQTKMTDRGRLKKAGEALMWKFKKEEIASILDRMERFKSLVEIALQMDNFKLSKAIKDDTNFVRTHIPTIYSRLDTIQQDQDIAQHGKIMAWISSTDYPAQQSDFISRRQEGTGQWFLDAPEVARWLGEPKKTLFCPGIPGAGKTMIAAIAIDHLLKAVQSSAVGVEVGVAYVYCNYKAQGEQDAGSLLAAILKQLVQAQPLMVEPVERLHRQHANRGTKPSTDEIFGALQSVLAKFSTVSVVVDALDECRDGDGTRRRFLAQLRTLQAGTDLHLMITSRFIPDIVDEFREALTLEVRASDEDVRRFVASQIYLLPKCIQHDIALQNMVQDKVVEAVDGMFLLARLHVDSLLDKRTKSKVQSTLETLSRGSKALEKAYEEAIERIKGQRPEDIALASSVISWITYAQRALTTEEICHALAVEPHEDSFNPDNLSDVEDIVSVCAGLVTVDEESNIIRLVHYTTQEYFERIQRNWNPTAQREITTTCLTYLSFNTFKSGSCASDKDFKDRLDQYPFLKYAARYWGRHALTVQKIVSNLALSLLEDSKLVTCVTQVVSASGRTWRYSGYSQSYPSDTVGLHLAASFELLHLLDCLLLRLDVSNVMRADSRDKNGRTPLSIAAERGHEEVVKLLVDRNDVEADSKDEHGRTPLSFAAGKGHEAVVKLLVGRDDVDPESNNRSGRTPLSFAAGKGHEAVVKLLVDRHDVDPESRNRSGLTPLSFAERRGHEAVAKLLATLPSHERGCSVSHRTDRICMEKSRLLWKRTDARYKPAHERGA